METIKFEFEKEFDRLKENFTVEIEKVYLNFE